MQVIIVTGGSRRIGAATSRLAVERGYSVCVNYHENAAAAKDVVEDIERQGGPSHCRQMFPWRRTS